ncbi:transposase [Nocardioides solisilvae]|uniref:transposase n=1 Tax=Nocardioides solisilvae TaxID=1542435 RepID=UPI000D741832|nr:transposase [Nocardioides solisilvae]
MSPGPDGQRCVVLTVDQRDSRRRPDAVGPVLERLATVPALLGFQRTAGDEFQGVLDDAAALPPVLELLLREGHWHVGLGLGLVETPLPTEAREARGSAFVAAREAVSSTRTAPWQLRVAGETPTARHLESVCWLWAAVLGRRTAKGWEVADLVDEGLSYEATGRRLGITQSAVSQRAAAAGLVEARRARELVAVLAGQWLRTGG